MPPSSVKVSVIMPAYNVAPYIDEAVESVLAQKGVSFELLIGDDGSKDGTWERIKNYPKKDSRVRVWKFNKNQGVSKISNYLIARSCGPYIAQCDADDLMLPNHLKHLVHVLDQKPNMGVVYGNLIQQLETGKRYLLRRSPGHTKTWDLIDGSIGNGGTLIRRNLIEKIGGYRSELSFLEDCDLFLRLSEITEFEYLENKASYVYRKRSESLSRQPKPEWVAIGRKIVKDAVLRRYGVKAKW